MVIPAASIRVFSSEEAVVTSVLLTKFRKSLVLHVMSFTVQVFLPMLISSDASPSLAIFPFNEQSAIQ